MERLDLLALADFNLVAKHGGFGRAARAAGRPKATLSRRVAELESSLGLRLFERGAHRLALTEEGRALHERTAALLTELDETASDIASGGACPRGTLRISVPLLFSQIAMGTLAARFALRYPDIRLEVTTEDRAVDMVEEGYDLVIRINPDPDETLVGRVFLRDRLVVVGRAGIDARRDAEKIPAVMRGTRASSTRWALRTSSGDIVLEVEPRLCMSSMIMVRDAVRAGIGIARLPLSLVSHDLARGSLVLWGEVDGPDIELWLLYPSRRLLSARVTAFVDFFREAFPSGTPEELAAYMNA
ncbi:DNA-binding transcriptional LysR family regulator [Tahibacter aquaticus]|uniref:DNA-binding transcriptional LysR family regulator n=1 Tax=Tahibacter aquaticus TaxID=520092 RepID=A0A4V3DKZ0_9GAMM|nr:LysR family transcriptional regulator [Tahibacter aquaticus]TDR37008.1 DNA-binding transcriptional LysR family regulator [Tahibacter aquaticus]